MQAGQGEERGQNPDARSKNQDETDGGEDGRCKKPEARTKNLKGARKK